jgi:hypothetical protein
MQWQIVCGNFDGGRVGHDGLPVSLVSGRKWAKSSLSAHFESEILADFPGGSAPGVRSKVSHAQKVSQRRACNRVGAQFYWAMAAVERKRPSPGKTVLLQKPAAAEEIQHHDLQRAALSHAPARRQRAGTTFQFR